MAPSKKYLQNVTKDSLIEYIEKQESRRVQDVGWGALMALPVAILWLKALFVLALSPGAVLLFTLIATWITVMISHLAITNTVRLMADRAFKKAEEDQAKLKAALDKQLEDRDDE